jgi:hypothetical protein
MSDLGGMVTRGIADAVGGLILAAVISAGAVCFGAGVLVGWWLL